MMKIKACDGIFIDPLDVVGDDVVRGVENETPSGEIICCKSPVVFVLISLAPVQDPTPQLIVIALILYPWD